MNLALLEMSDNLATPTNTEDDTLRESGRLGLLRSSKTRCARAPGVLSRFRLHVSELGSVYMSQRVFFSSGLSLTR